MATSGVPPGFRFHPTDEELLHYYLKKKISFSKFDMEVIREVDLNKIEPWDLQERCRIGSSTVQNDDWYFFSHKDRKYPTGSRTNRATSAGFWKATGRDKCIRNSFKKIGMRKTLVFYRGRAPHGQKTDWIMHEYRLEDVDHHDGNLSTEDGWVVCRVFKKKNLFKVGSTGGGGTSSSTSINSDHHHQQQQQLMINSSSSSLINIPTADDHHHYQQPLLGNNQHHSQIHNTSFDLYNNKMTIDHNHDHNHNQHHHHLSLNYPNVPLPQNYDLYSSNLASDAPLMVRQLMSNSNNNVRSDCGGTSSASEHHTIRYEACEPSLEAGTSDPNNQINMVAGGNNYQWTMQLDRDIITTHDHQQVSSKDHHLSLRGEMDFWGYQK